MADQWSSIFFRVKDLKGAFANLLFDDDKQILAPQKAIDGAGLVIDPPLASIVDTTTTAGSTYICEAPAGTSSSSAGWRIQKITVSGGITSTTWANGGKFDQVAANRASLDYA